MRANGQGQQALKHVCGIGVQLPVRVDMRVDMSILLVICISLSNAML
jgi:hypothetical protein